MKNASRLIILLAVAALCADGCVSLPPVNAPVARVQPPQPAQTDWEPVETGMDRRVYASSTLQAAMTVYRLDPAHFDFRFETATTTQTMAQWSSEFPDAALIVNGVYFHEDNLPSGYLSSHGTAVGIRRFDLDKSGLIALDDGVHIYDTSVNPPRFDSFADAAQSYPLFFKSGKPAIKEDSQKPARRSFIGKDARGNVYIGVVPSAQISLYQTMLMLGETGIEWANVINLDGGPSTGITTKAESVPSLFPVPNVIAVFRKP
ncbi:MAG TPA: phosphodiester glycosidase family protein [Verrucomicrobiae bacterium]|nr:phosphodiester glycosidase family protein [Verrucomicrobiae bacterium]